MNLYFLQPPYLQRYADAVAGEGAPLYNCFYFVNGKIVYINNVNLFYMKRRWYIATTQ